MRLRRIGVVVDEITNKKAQKQEGRSRREWWGCKEHPFGHTRRMLFSLRAYKKRIEKEKEQFIGSL